MPAIDIHTHAFPDSLAGRAIAQLQADCPWKAVGSGTVEGLLRSMDAAGVEAAVVCTIATKPDQAAGILTWCRQIASERIIPLASVHPETPDAAGWVRRIAEAGLAGLKLHPMYQAAAADDPRMLAVFAAATQAGLLVQCHCGRDIGFPDSDDRAHPRRLRAVIDQLPALKLLCTHLGGWRMWDQAERYLLGSPVHLETSFSLAELGPQRSAAMIRRHGTGKVLFGSDWPWADQAGDLALLRALPLDAAELDAIAHANARVLLNLSSPAQQKGRP
jgi:predicted TIM-barrel fold metal-dependent hydrolase